MTIIIYLIGKPGTGKYSIAKELALHDYIICDNQLINNPIFSLLQYDGLMQVPLFAWTTISKIRNAVFDFLKEEKSHNYVLTNVLYCDEYDLFAKVEQIAHERHSLFVPVKLLINQEEHIKRIQNKERLLRFKSIDINDTSPEKQLINIIHPNLLELDVTYLSAKAAANIILTFIKTISVETE